LNITSSAIVAAPFKGCHDCTAGTCCLASNLMVVVIPLKESLNELEPETSLFQ
jgi:hypothetical protein